MLVNGQLETPIATVKLHFEIGDIKFVERFIVKANLSNSLIVLLFLQRNGLVLDMRQAILNFPLFSMKLKDADDLYLNMTEPCFTHNTSSPGR